MEIKILTLEIRDSFSGLGDSDEELELETLESLEISLTESYNEAEDVGRGNLSDAGKQKRVKAIRSEEVERVVKEILSRHKDFNMDSKETRMERMVEG